ncbi:MAG TPA: hypothetical protein ENH94_03320 [Phycisphaerales bacterium]|nr:hypothetical protein [Phycisphaerales bacterium]
MSRNVGRKALFEALKKGQDRIAKGHVTRNLRYPEPAKTRITGSNAENIVHDDDIEAWPPQRQPVAAISGRIEVSLPYPMAAMVVIVAILIGVALFKVGQISGSNAEKAAAAAAKADYEEVYTRDQVFGEEDDRAATAEAKDKIEKKKEDQILLGPVGDHIIIIAMCTESRDLDPVIEYFADNGIETLIDKRGSDYFLVTKKKYQSPKKVGSDGNIALKWIKQIGGTYVAPDGYHGFGAMPFQDAYGDRIR